MADANGLGAAQIAGTGAPVGGKPYTLPPVTIPTPGGSRTPPPRPTPLTPSEMKAAGSTLIRHVWEDMDPAVELADARQGRWVETSDGNLEYGYVQITVEGVDVTRLFGAATPLPKWRRGEPFGPQWAEVELPQLTAFHTLPAWTHHGANLSLTFVKSTGPDVSLFEGVIVDRKPSSRGVFALQAIGILLTGDLTLRLPSFDTDPQDIGHLIPELFDDVISRRWLDTVKVTTGITTSVAGGREKLLTGFVQRILATALHEGKQWTVTCRERTPALELKDTTTIAWEVHFAQRGVEVQVTSDATQAPNAYYGTGINPDNGAWSNTLFPLANKDGDDSPEYCFEDAGRSIVVGTRDSDTDTGNGVTLVQRKLGRAETGRWSWGDAEAAERFQEDHGLLVDGVVGPQTWASLFDIGANVGILEPYFAPLAAAPEVEPRLRGTDGEDLGPNPNYDPNVLRVEDTIEYGQGVSRSEGRRDARERLARDSDPGWQGTIRFTVDPKTKSRLELMEGENGLIRGVPGAGDIVVHVAKVSQDGTATVCDIDTKARDYPTLKAIRERKANATDPAKAARGRILQGTIAADRPVYDAESKAGRIPEHAIREDLFDIRRIPMLKAGAAVSLEVKTFSPATEFSFAVFGKPITAAQLQAIVGNPLAQGADPLESPWDVHAKELREKYWFIDAWGWQEQPAGLGERARTTPNGKTSAPVTGELLHRGSWQYVTERSPWLYVATISRTSCFVKGRIYGAPV